MLIRDLTRLMRTAQCFDPDPPAPEHDPPAPKPTESNDLADRLAKAEAEAKSARDELAKIAAERKAAEAKKLADQGQYKTLAEKHEAELALAREKIALYEAEKKERDNATKVSNKERAAALPERMQETVKKFAKTMAPDALATFIGELEALNSQQATDDAGHAQTPASRPPPRQPRGDAAEREMEAKRRKSLDIMLGKRPATD